MIKGDAAIMLQEKLDALNWLLTQKIKKHFMYNTLIFFQTLQRYRIFIDSLFPTCCLIRTARVMTLEYYLHFALLHAIGNCGCVLENSYGIVIIVNADS